MAKPFRPPKMLSGDIVAPPGTGAEFTVPDGWMHGPAQEADGTQVYALAPKVGGGGISITRRPLSQAEAAWRPSMLLQLALEQKLQGHPVTPVVSAEDLEVAGQPAARTIVRGHLNGQELELYLAGVVADGYGFLISAMWPVGSPDNMRAAFDTVLSTFRGSAPGENVELRAQLVGRWNNIQGDTDLRGSTSSRQTVCFNADGTYSYRSRMRIEADGAGSISSGSDEQGRYRVEGNTVTTTSDQGEVDSYDVTVQGGHLFIGRDRYIRCG